MKKEKLAQDLAGLLNPATPETATPAPAPAPKGRPRARTYKVFSYNITPELAEKINYIAYYDRRKVRDVVEEAFAQYVENWKPQNEKPRKL